MRFAVGEELFGLFPGLKIGVLVCEIDNTRYGDDRLEAVIDEVRGGFTHVKVQDHPNIRAWREAFASLGITGSKYFSSAESLLRRALKGGPFPRINPIVDLYNTISLQYVVPMGGHALSALEGDIVLCRAAGGERFTPMDSWESEVVPEGEVIYRDEREVLTRRWVWRQCNKDRVGPETRFVFIPIDVLPSLPEPLCESVMLEMELGLARNGYGRVIHRDIVTGEKQVTVFET